MKNLKRYFKEKGEDADVSMSVSIYKDAPSLKKLKNQINKFVQSKNSVLMLNIDNSELAFERYSGDKFHLRLDGEFQGYTESAEGIIKCLDYFVLDNIIGGENGF